ncbi:hypothetical protein HELRODRAFT_184611, partial [Helobdella robusta]|uniref:Intraflagellar transport protein 74 homolog n=1 Tax=Helobdella robusta TaxID=6412 RepID=T1FLL1_HELRO
MNIIKIISGIILRQGNVPLGTASRLKTGAVQGIPRPGTRGGVIGTGMALLSQVQVSDRPVTQQGLGGLKTTTNKGNQRMVQDKTYFLGVLRAESLAQELETLRGELGDYNTLVDKLNTDTNINDMQLEVND